jgi:hypothetical protein
LVGYEGKQGMEKHLIGFMFGAAFEAVTGLILSLFDWWLKDFRDVHLKSAGMPLPSDRVFKRYHWPFAILGVINAVVLSIALKVPPMWAALSVFGMPLLFLPIFIGCAIFRMAGILFHKSKRFSDGGKKS